MIKKDLLGGDSDRAFHIGDMCTARITLRSTPAGAEIPTPWPSRPRMRSVMLIRAGDPGTSDEYSNNTDHLVVDDAE